MKELETKSKINIRDLYMNISELKKVYQPRTNPMRGVMWLQTPTVLRLDGGNIFHSKWMYMGLMMLGRQKYMQQNH